MEALTILLVFRMQRFALGTLHSSMPMVAADDAQVAAAAIDPHIPVLLFRHRSVWHANKVLRNEASFGERGCANVEVFGCHGSS